MNTHKHSMNNIAPAACMYMPGMHTYTHTDIDYIYRFLDSKVECKIVQIPRNKKCKIWPCLSLSLSPSRRVCWLGLLRLLGGKCMHYVYDVGYATYIQYKHHTSTLIKNKHTMHYIRPISNIWSATPLRQGSHGESCYFQLQLFTSCRHCLDFVCPSHCAECGSWLDRAGSMAADGMDQKWPLGIAPRMRQDISRTSTWDAKQPTLPNTNTNVQTINMCTNCSCYTAGEENDALQLRKCKIHLLLQVCKCP